MENRLEVAKKWLDENSEELEAFKGLVRCINEITRERAYHSLVFKRLSDFIGAFAICMRDNLSFKDLSAATLLTNSPRAINAYKLFDEYIEVVRNAIKRAIEPEIAFWRLPTDVNSFEVSLQYLRENITEEEIVEYLD